LYAKAKIHACFDCDKVLGVCDEILKLKEAHPNDLLISKLYVRSLLTFKDGGTSELFFEEFELKLVWTRVREANLKLVEQHGYTKLVPRFD